MSQLHQAAEDPLDSGEHSAGQAQGLSAGTGEDISIRHADRTVLVISERQEEAGEEEEEREERGLQDVSNTKSSSSSSSIP